MAGTKSKTEGQVAVDFIFGKMGGIWHTPLTPLPRTTPKAKANSTSPLQKQFLFDHPG